MADSARGSPRTPTNRPEVSPLSGGRRSGDRSGGSGQQRGDSSGQQRGEPATPVVSPTMQRILEGLGTSHLNVSPTQRLPPYLYADYETSTSGKDVVNAALLDETVAPRPSLRVFTCIPCIKRYRNCISSTQLKQSKQLEPEAVCDCHSVTSGSRCNHCKADSSKPSCYAVCGRAFSVAISGLTSAGACRVLPIRQYLRALAPFRRRYS